MEYCPDCNCSQPKICLGREIHECKSCQSIYDKKSREIISCGWMRKKKKDWIRSR